MKTFYSVDFNINGYVQTKWFESKEEAMEFYHSQERVDKPVRHTYKDKEKNDYVEEQIAYQRMPY